MIPNLDRDPSGETLLIQKALNALGYSLTEDNWKGRKTEVALEHWRSTWQSKEWHVVNASSFGDPADVRAFNRCKSTGKTDMECFAVGDNGIGKWGHITASESSPMVALPREDWIEAGKSGGDKVIVRYNGKEVHAILGDTMPWRRHIKNGAGIDLNPAAAKALGLKPPLMVEGVEWRWA